MKLNRHTLGKTFLAVVVMSTLVLTAACKTTYSVPAPPAVTITAAAGIPAGSVTVTAQVTNFALVDPVGQANAAAQGHLHYFLDVTPPTTPGQAAVTAPGTYVATAATSNTWVNVAPGPHTFSVELVNNDHTPLVPPVVTQVAFTVK